MDDYFIVTLSVEAGLVRAFLISLLSMHHLAFEVTIFSCRDHLLNMRQPSLGRDNVVLLRGNVMLGQIFVRELLL